MYIGLTDDKLKLEISPNRFKKHGVVFGMTGSGKTGLSIVLLEELAKSNVPVFAIDPKGDLANLCLAFPNVSAQQFSKWTPTEQAAIDAASVWRNGLAKSGVSPTDVAEYVKSVDFHLYTPGRDISPISILSTPKTSEDIPIFIHTLTSLVGMELEFHDAEFVLLSLVLEQLMQSGRSYSITNVAEMVYSPPFTKVGFMPINDFISKRKRNELARLINGLAVSPQFKQWLSGPPFILDAMVKPGPTGASKVNIMNISGLSDDERMGFVTFFFEKVNAYMRTLPASDEVKFVVYMDEVFGYMPPVANPPSKQPILSLLKQGRAFGVSCILATQNPKDIDYKGLSNIANWFTGKLSTKNDRDRLLEGMSESIGASCPKELGLSISKLKKREFIYYDGTKIHPFKTRHTMSYLRGPMADVDLRRLLSLSVKRHRDQTVEKIKRILQPAPVKDSSTPKPKVYQSPKPVEKTPDTTFLGGLIGMFGRRKARR